MLTDETTDVRCVVMLVNTAVRANSTTKHCVALPMNETEYMIMAHGAKTAFAFKAMLDLFHPHLIGSAIDVYGE